MTMMSDVNEEGDSVSEAAEPRTFETIRGFVVAAIRKAYRGWETDPARRGIADPRAREALARLRAAATAPPGASPEVWEYLPGDPAICIRNDIGSVSVRGAATPQEVAAHHTLALWATHQQSKSEPMHDDRIRSETSEGARPFGQAVYLLARKRDGEADSGDIGPVQRRFVAALRAQSMNAMVVQLRGLIRMLRDESIAFDYGRFAQDLLWFQLPNTRARVQRQWSRDFHRFVSIDNSPNTVQNPSPDNEAQEA